MRVHRLLWKHPGAEKSRALCWEWSQKGITLSAPWPIWTQRAALQPWHTSIASDQDHRKDSVSCGDKTTWNRCALSFLAQHWLSYIPISHAHTGEFKQTLNTFIWWEHLEVSKNMRGAPRYTLGASTQVCVINWSGRAQPVQQAPAWDKPRANVKVQPPQHTQSASLSRANLLGPHSMLKGLQMRLTCWIPLPQRWLSHLSISPAACCQSTHFISPSNLLASWLTFRL